MRSCHSDKPVKVTNTQTHKHETPAKLMCRHLMRKAGMHPDKMSCKCSPHEGYMVGLQQHTLKCGDGKGNCMFVIIHIVQHSLQTLTRKATIMVIFT